MANVNVALLTFNRGLIGKSALARTDFDRLNLSSEVQTNYIPRTLGSMSMRPGLEKIVTTRSSLKAILIPFVFATTDTALIEMTDSNMRVLVNDVVITRPSVSTTITNGAFTTDLTGWTDNDTFGAESIFRTGIKLLFSTYEAGGGFLSLSNGAVSLTVGVASRYQTVTVTMGDMNVVHAVRIIVRLGIVVFKIGTTQGDDDVLSESRLTEGEHSLAFTPGATSIVMQFDGQEDYESFVDSIVIEASGEMLIPTPYAESELFSIRYEQSADVIFLAHKDHRPMRIERRATESWSIVFFNDDSGPYLLAKFDNNTMNMTGGNAGDTVVDSSPGGVFNANMVGGLLQLNSSTQIQGRDLSGIRQYTRSIRVEGSGTDRDVLTNIVGAFAGTVELQQSIGIDGQWDRPEVKTFTAPVVNDVFNDGFDGSTVYYRAGFQVLYTSGTPTVSVTNRSIPVKVNIRVTHFVDTTRVVGIILNPDSGGFTLRTEGYSFGAWSIAQGFPSSVVLYEGRLWFSGKSRVWGSVSDAFDVFDADTIGDSGPLDRSIGFGPVDEISWMLRLNRLILGTQGAELSVRSSSFNEPLTRTNFNIKDPSNQGSSAVPAVKVDATGFFAQRTGDRLFELAYDSADGDYISRDVSIHVPEVGRPGIVRLGSQRQPDTRIHCIRSDGTVAMLIYDKLEKVLCWVSIETDGVIEEVVTLPGTEEEDVYYIVARQVNSVTTRFIEKWEKESTLEMFTQIYDGVSATVLDVDFENGTTVTVRDTSGVKIGINLVVTAGKITLATAQTNIFITTSFSPIADSFTRFDFVTPTATLTGLADYVGLEVVVWADGKDQGKFTVAVDEITLLESVEVATVGLSYRARYRSTKLTYATEANSALNQIKKVERLGLILRHTHNKGIKFGPAFDQLDDMPLYEHDLGDVDADFIFNEYDKEMHRFDGDWNTDSRINIETVAPFPCTVLALVVGIEADEDL